MNSTNKSIAVVVPTYNSAAVIGSCLASIAGQSYAPAQVVVCDGGSTDDTVNIARNCGAMVITAPANRSGQRNVGARMTTSDFVLFVDSDMRLTPGVLKECVRSFTDDTAALVLPEVDIGTSYWARVRGFERGFYRDAWWLQAARCFRRAEFENLGGFDVGLVGAEDWDLDERIRRFGNVKSVSASIEHNEGAIRFRTLIEKKTHYATSFANFTAAHPARSALCFSGRRRILLILRRPRRLVASPSLTAGLAFLGVSEIMVAHGLLRFRNSDYVERPVTRDT